MYETSIYKTSSGKEPYVDWMESLDRSVRVRINAKITRFRETGHIANCEPVGGGLFEMKFDFGPGYRIYCGYEADTFLILLLGGIKKGQQKDINKAKEYWLDHLSQKKR